MAKKKIMIIDDEVELVNLVKFRLELNGYRVIPLYTSSRAMEIVKREKPDLVLLDIMMPDKGGYEVCTELKDDKDTKHIPIILFTAKTHQKEYIKDGSKSVGAEDYILKPFDPAELLVKIRLLLKEKKDNRS